MNKKDCSTCLYTDKDGVCVAERCDIYMSGWRPRGNQPITFADKYALPKEEKFSLDKLIDDHWEYNEQFASCLLPYEKTDWGATDILNMAEFVYKSAFRHGFKHALEHYGIEEKNDE